MEYNMDYNNLINLYTEVQEDLRFIIASEVRMKILLCLNEDSKNLKLLSQQTGFLPSTISHENKKLQERNIIFKENRFFYLSPIGKIILMKIIELYMSKSLFKRSKRFFLNHNINCIPKHLLQEIECLHDTELLETTSKNIFYPQKIIYKHLKNSRKVKGLYPVFFPKQLEIFKQLIKNDVEINLILTEEIMDHLLESVGKESLNKALSRDNLVLWRTNEELKINLVMSDKFLSLALFSNNGIFDSSSILLGKKRKALDWGDKLFKYYLKSAEEIVLE
ncbi:MAG: DUF1724 domain-containing protein [Methanobacteriaceae archaeon]|nr:DUF1724 domain-containing protein [Methanobacteriaceae archaeon]